MNRVLRDGFFHLLGVILGCVLGGCASQRQVVVGLSPDVETYYAMYPSIEFDAVAVTSEEADQIKSEGVDKYFAPASPLRKRLAPFTVYFSQEHTQPEILPYRSNYWDRWQKKKPETLVLIANLPHSPDMPENDPRVLYIDLKKGGLFVKPVYVEIEPQKITRIFDKPQDPQTNLPAENQKPDAQRSDTRIHGDAEKEK
ncbi:MAG: hypothetical protein LBF75_09240 [Treponema sp.]|nr:hypothetical protein [Treponema sp.]